MEKRFYLYFMLAAAETAVLIYFAFQSTIPYSSQIPDYNGFLKHFIAYSVYGFLLYKTFRYSHSHELTMILAISIGTIMGALTEIIQGFIPFRVLDIMDFLVNVFGSYVGVNIVVLSRKAILQKEKAPDAISISPTSLENRE